MAKTRSNRAYIQGIAWSSIGSVVSLFAGFLPIMFASRMIDREQMGAFFLLLAVVNVSHILGDLGLRTITIKVISESQYGSRDLVSCVATSIRLLAALATMVVLALVTPLLLVLWSDEAFSKVAWFAVPIVGLEMAWTSAAAVQAGFQRFKFYAAINTFASILRGGLCIAFLLLGFGLRGLAWGVLTSCLVLAILTWTWLPFCYRFSLAARHSSLLLRLGGWVHVSSILSVVRVRTAEALLATFTGFIGVASYGIAARIPNMLIRLFDAVRPVILTYMSAPDSNPVSASLLGIRVLSGILSVAAGGMIVLAPGLVVVLFGPMYADCAPVFRLLSYWVVQSVLQYFLSISLVGMGQLKHNVLTQAVMCVLLICGHVLLIPRLGAEGAAISMAMTSTLGLFVSIRMVTGRNWRLFADFTIAVARSVVPLFLFVLMAYWGNMTIASAGLGFCVLVVSLAILRAVTPADIAFFLDRMRPAPVTTNPVRGEQP